MNDKITELLTKALDLTVAYGLDLIGAIVILIVGWTVAGWGAAPHEKSPG